MEDDKWPESANEAVRELRKQIAKQKRLLKNANAKLRRRDNKIVILDDELTTYKEEYTQKVIGLAAVRKMITEQQELLKERGDMIAELKEQLGQKTGEAFGLQVEVRELKEQLAASQEGNRMLLERLRKLYALLREFREHASEIIFENETS
ncbi:MAG: hypothetical protein UT11_C0058G0001 [Berkelbacteria bacterium GW2011_GWA2_38_9]|uniref:Uncharacterized protein n=1 Tax=Berkelbacteria bacterium GW2011_GWA2_38_9 TaxID=1618334 RepID=A0A0G0LGD2_9BACT|nr:MAG: hypothetical protein UT11_C0058G0001 [Berkelbacteria bacterium GW2011_GWA2_38_9]